MRDSAIAGIEPAKGEIVWGVLYELTTDALARLDIIEGYAPGRDPSRNEARRLLVRVQRPDGISADAETHVPVPMDDPGRPSTGYLLVLVRAATALDFPDEYIARLKATQAGALAA